MNLTEHFTLEELTRSDYARRKNIDNAYTNDVFANLKVLADGLERVRDVLAVPIHVTSGYRSQLLNSLIGGARNSQHTKGLAADFVAPQFGTPKEIVTELMTHRHNVKFDQLILEFNDWVHVSFTTEVARSEVLFYDGSRYSKWH